MGVTNSGWATTDWCRYAWCVPTGYEKLPVQLTMVSPVQRRIGVQFRMVAYNITQLRILWEIKSDGISASNFTSSTDASTDKAVINLKSDIIEKYWQSTGVTTEWVQWDSGSGHVISLDTFALIGHNLTSSAVVVLKGSGASGDAAPGDWSVVPAYATMTMSDDPDEENLIWISPSSPANSYRHWRLEIADTTNTDGYIRIGRLVAGSALIFNGENCLDNISLTDQNFKDAMNLNGFSEISNNRALKRRMNITFRDLDRISNTNYRLLRRYMRYCRDSLKALVIVDPQSEESKYQFTTFAKLKSMPEQSHRYIDTSTAYSSLSLEYDEGR